MNNELIELKSWWKRNWKGCVPVSVVVLFQSEFYSLLE